MIVIMKILQLITIFTLIGNVKKLTFFLSLTLQLEGPQGISINVLIYVHDILG